MKRSSVSVAACPAPPGTAKAAAMLRSMHIRFSSAVVIASNAAGSSLTIRPVPRLCGLWPGMSCSHMGAFLLWQVQPDPDDAVVVAGGLGSPVVRSG
jgi:hypothetical protein